MYTLFWETISGAMAPQAMMEEMGITYEKIAIDMAANEHRTEAYLAQIPTAQVPALKLDDGRVMGESAAIVLFLGEQHPEGKLVPVPGDKERPTFLFWLMYMATSGYMTFGQVMSSRAPHHRSRRTRPPFDLRRRLRLIGSSIRWKERSRATRTSCQVGFRHSTSISQC